MSFICFCGNKIGAKLRVYLEESTYLERRLLLSNRCCPLLVVASRILRSFGSDGKELFGYHIQSNCIQSSPPESFLILLFRYWRPLIRFLPRDFYFFISRCCPQLFLRAKSITLFLIPVSIVRSLMWLSAFPCTLSSCSSSRMHAL